MVEDKRLEYRIIQEFKKRGIPFAILDGIDENVDVIVSDIPRDFGAIVLRDERKIARRVISYEYGQDRFRKVITGIDPGPKPGIAVVGDGHIVEELHLSSVDLVGSVVDEIYEGYLPYSFVVRVGNGDIVNRNRIVNDLVDRYRVEIVDERNTTNSITNSDVESAKVIAFSKGRVVRSKLNTVIREGYLKEVQRRSRIESGGLITISKDLAKMVAMGKISLGEAIERTREGR